MKLKREFILLITAFAISNISVAQTCIGVDTECDGSTNYCFNCTGGNCGPFELSNGIYRIPYIDGTDVTITNDHLNHCPRGRIDMVGSGGPTPYKIAVAADGWIRAIEDDNTVQCDCSVSSCRNNYVWIEHPNGEWTKYTHMVVNSVTDLGHSVGDWVTAGTYLGKEGDVGCASGEHLHFEVAQPIDTNTLVFSEYGGYIDFDWAKNVIPVICSISGNVFSDGVEYFADDCGACSASMVNLPETFSAGEFDADIATSTVSGSAGVIFDDYSSGLYQAGASVTLLDGFEARQNSEFTARIGGCNDTPGKTASSNPETELAEIFVFPNPATTAVTLRWYEHAEHACEIHITDMAGRYIKTIAEYQKYNSGFNQIYFDVSGLDDGMYFIQIYSKIKTRTVKLIVQH